jgi:hypothetical protein
MNPVKKIYKSGPFQSRQSGWCGSWRSHAMDTGATSLHRGTESTTLSESRRRNHVVWHGATQSRQSIRRDWPAKRPGPLVFLFSLSFFLLLFHLVEAPLAILDFSPLIGAHGATNRLHELVSQSCWVRMLEVVRKRSWRASGPILLRIDALFHFNCINLLYETCNALYLFVVWNL